MSDFLAQLTTALADRYTIERELGRGGMATVYLAEDLKHHRKVAIKVLRPELAASIGVDRFLREIEIAANLTHPHILPLHDSGEVDGFLFYVIPFIEGESLRDRLLRERQLPVEAALKLTQEVASALSYAHALGVIHRDIKPENIMLSAGGAVIGTRLTGPRCLAIHPRSKRGKRCKRRLFFRFRAPVSKSWTPSNTTVERPNWIRRG